jgi:hypothetical protein
VDNHSTNPYFVSDTIKLANERSEPLSYGTGLQRNSGLNAVDTRCQAVVQGTAVSVREDCLIRLLFNDAVATAGAMNSRTDYWIITAGEQSEICNTKFMACLEVDCCLH